MHLVASVRLWICVFVRALLSVYNQGAYADSRADAVGRLLILDCFTIQGYDIYVLHQDVGDPRQVMS